MGVKILMQITSLCECDLGWSWEQSVKSPTPISGTWSQSWEWGGNHDCSFLFFVIHGIELFQKHVSRIPSQNIDFPSHPLTLIHTQKQAVGHKKDSPTKQVVIKHNLHVQKKKSFQKIVFVLCEVQNVSDSTLLMAINCKEDILGKVNSADSLPNNLFQLIYIQSYKIMLLMYFFVLALSIKRKTSSAWMLSS